MNRAFVHLELNTDDIERARAFYREVLGWDFQNVPVAGQKYVQIATPRPPGGGIQLKPHDKMPSHWMPYVSVDDVRAAVRRARSAGAKIVADVSEVPGYGALAIITDPTGATFGVWQVDSPAKKAANDDAPAKSGEPKKKAAKKKATKKKATKKKVTKKAAPAKKKVAKKKVAKKKATKKAATKKKATKKKATKKKSSKKKSRSARR
jgi:predicted enzyme related to lactoylglutathione lyase